MKYRINITQSVVQGTQLIVEAKDQDEAEDLALRFAENSLDQDSKLIVWDIVDVEGDCEIIGCEEIKQALDVT